MRHESIFTPSEYPYPIHIIGVGATGSRVFASLIELGMTNLHIYDPDVVESHNLANQIYTTDDVGKPKVHGCYEFARRKLGIDPAQHISTYETAITTARINSSNILCGGIVFLMTDTMESRRNIFRALINRYNINQQAYLAPLAIIETRMASTHGSVFLINPFDTFMCSQWESTLVKDENVDSIEQSPCGTSISVGATAALIANYAVWQMINCLTNPIGVQPRIDLFFKPVFTATPNAIAA